MYSSKVAQHLLDRGRVTQGQIDEAVRTQGFFGGQLESHLFKLGYVDEATLGHALTEASGVPFASGEHLRAAPADSVRVVPTSLLERHRVCPFRLDDRRLRVAMLNPRDLAAIRDLQQATGYVVEPWITTEYRLYQALERHWKVRFEGIRAIGLAPASDPVARAEREETSREEPPGPEPEVGLDGLPLDAEPTFEHVVRRPDDEPAPPPLPPPTPVRETRDFDALSRLDDALSAATDRDGIADALLDFAGTRAKRVALFAVGRDGVRGVAGRGRAFETEKLRKLALPPHSGTVFETALGSRDFYFGVVPALPPNRDLYTALGGRLPVSVLILPVVVKERVAALLYLDADDAPITSPDIPTMRRVALKAGLAFEMLLLRTKLRGI